MDSDESLNNDIEMPWLEILPEDLMLPDTAAVSRQRIRLWALTLDSRSVPCLIEKYRQRLRLLVPPAYYAAALYELRCFEELNRTWPPLPPEPGQPAGSTLAVISVLILLAAFFIISHIPPGGTIRNMPDWFEAGSARAALILDRQWWRTITALTLHRDVLHLLGNLTFGGIFIFMLCRELGSGAAWSAAVAAGSLGNLINAFVQPAGHTSVGASTAVFGTVGILAALAQSRYRQNQSRRWPLPAAAALALLALLGSEGKQTDLGAHLFGLASGLAVGFAAGVLIARSGPPGRRLNILLALLSAVAVFSAWWLAVVNAA